MYEGVHSRRMPREEPLWWEPARQLYAYGFTLAAVARFVGKDASTVRYAVLPEFRKRKQQKNRAWWEVNRYPHPKGAEARVRSSILRAAVGEARDTGQHVDLILMQWGTYPRWAERRAPESLEAA